MAYKGAIGYDPEQAAALCAAVLSLCKLHEEIKTNLEPRVKALEGEEVFGESDTKTQAHEAVANTYAAMDKVGSRMAELEKVVSEVAGTIEESAAINIKSSSDAADIVAAAKRKAETADGKQ